MVRVGDPHAPSFVFAAGEFHMSFHQPGIQFPEITLHLVAVGSFTNMPSYPGLDTNGFATPEFSLYKLCSFPFYHISSYSALCYTFCQFRLAQLSSLQVSGWPLKALFKNECNICHLPFLWCLAVSTAAVVLY